LAQGIAAWDATLAAAWLHGRVADDRGDSGLVASDIAPLAAALLRRLRGFSG
jgi:NAD(P)H-hydrate repair Nnr-like enzyme with NAD(P)H-hydrate dehydratase domain